MPQCDRTMAKDYSVWLKVKAVLEPKKIDEIDRTIQGYVGLDRRKHAPLKSFRRSSGQTIHHSMRPFLELDLP